MGCCCIRAIQRDIERQTAANMALDGMAPPPPGAGGRGGGGLAGGIQGLAAGLGGAIMQSVGAGIAAAKARADYQKELQFRAGPKMMEDGSLRLDYLDGKMAFSPAYLEFMKPKISQEQWWAVIVPVNQELANAKAAVEATSGSTDATGAVQGNLMAGNMHAMHANMGNIMGAARNLQAAQQAGFDRIRAVLFDQNKKLAEAGVGLEFRLDADRWTTREYRSPPPNSNIPGRHETVEHVAWYLGITVAGGAASWPAGALGAANAQREAAIAAARVELGPEPGTAAAAPAPAGAMQTMNPAFGAAGHPPAAAGGYPAPAAGGYPPAV